MSYTLHPPLLRSTKEFCSAKLRLIGDPELGRRNSYSSTRANRTLTLASTDPHMSSFRPKLGVLANAAGSRDVCTGQSEPPPYGRRRTADPCGDLVSSRASPPRAVSSTLLTTFNLSCTATTSRCWGATPILTGSRNPSKTSSQDKGTAWERKQRR